MPACRRCPCPSARFVSSIRLTAGSSATGRFSTPATLARAGVSARARATTRPTMTWYRFGEWILRRRFLVLFWVGVLTCFFAYFAARTELVTSFGDLLPQNHPFVQVAHQYDTY